MKILKYKRFNEKLNIKPANLDDLRGTDLKSLVREFDIVKLFNGAYYIYLKSKDYTKVMTVKDPEKMSKGVFLTYTRLASGTGTTQSFLFFEDYDESLNITSDNRMLDVQAIYTRDTRAARMFPVPDSREDAERMFGIVALKNLTETDKYHLISYKPDR